MLNKGLISVLFLVSSLKAQSTTPSAAVAPVVAETNSSFNGGFLSAVSARKQKEKGAQVSCADEQHEHSSITLLLQLEAAISSQLEVDLTLEQDGMQGVDECEWVSPNLLFINCLLTISS